VNRAALAHYGIDPDDFVYRFGRPAGPGWCEACRLHPANLPLPNCDLEQSRAWDIEDEGYPAAFCFHCHSAFPAMLSVGALCPRCQRTARKREAELNRPWTRKNPTIVRVPDGVGCTEAVPRWMTEPEDVA